MEQNDKNMVRLLEMLDNPGAYSEQEMRDIINADDRTREAYRLMVLSRSAGFARRDEDGDVDTDEAWRRFEQHHFPDSRQRRPALWLKVAATIAGILFISGIAVAAVHGIMRRAQEPQAAVERPLTVPVDTAALAVAGEPAAAAAGPVSFDNVPLEKILEEMAAYYHVGVVFRNDEVRQLRFHYEWHPDAGLAPAIDGLNHFKRVNVECVDSQLIVMRP